MSAPVVAEGVPANAQIVVNADLVNPKLALEVDVVAPGRAAPRAMPEVVLVAAVLVLPMRGRAVLVPARRA